MARKTQKPKKPDPPAFKGDPLKSAKYVKYLNALTFPTAAQPLTNIPADRRPTLQEWDFMKRLRAREAQKEIKKKAATAVRRGADPIVADLTEEESFDTFSFDNAARVSFTKDLSPEETLAANAIRLKERGYELQDNAGHLRNRALSYTPSLYKWMQDPAQIAQEKMLANVYPAALSLKTGIADAGDILSLSIGDKPADAERWVALTDRLTINAITARLLLFVKDHFKLNPQEAELYLRYHLHQTFGNQAASDTENLLRAVLNVTKENAKTPALPYPQSAGSVVSPRRKKNAGEQR